MSELIYVFKMLAITFILMILMQIRVGDTTIENHATEWVHTAAPVLFLREIAEGGLAATHDAWVKVTGGIKSKYWNKFDTKNIPGQRQLNVGLERSQAYVEKQKEKAEALAEEQRLKREKVESELSARAKKVKSFIGWDDEAESAVSDEDTIEQ